MKSRSVNHDQTVIESLQKNKELALVYLNEVLQDGNQEECLLALRRVAEATGGISKVAKDASIHEKSLHRALSPRGNPTLKNLRAICQALGIQLTFTFAPEKVAL